MDIDVNALTERNESPLDLASDLGDSNIVLYPEIKGARRSERGKETAKKQ